MRAFFLGIIFIRVKNIFLTIAIKEYKTMITRTWKNNPITPQSKNVSYNPFQWAKDFEKEVLENNRKIFSRIYNTDVEERWLKIDND